MGGLYAGVFSKKKSKKIKTQLTDDEIDDLGDVGD
jgi:hypothetical protein